MMRTLVLVFGGALAFPVLAQRASVAPWVTGEQLVRKLDAVDARDVPWTRQSHLSRDELAALHTHANVEFVRGYIAALHDATEGRTWCFSDKTLSPNPDVFWDESRWRLASLPAIQKKRAAADLLPAIWRTAWPCPIDSGRVR